LRNSAAREWSIFPEFAGSQRLSCTRTGRVRGRIVRSSHAQQPVPPKRSPICSLYTQKSLRRARMFRAPGRLLDPEAAKENAEFGGDGVSCPASATPVIGGNVPILRGGPPRAPGPTDAQIAQPSWQIDPLRPSCLETKAGLESTAGRAWHNPDRTVGSHSGMFAFHRFRRLFLQSLNEGVRDS
jgi:hypothetical protein